MRWRYAVIAWLLLPAPAAPAWVLRVFIAVFAAGFPVALIFAGGLRDYAGRGLCARKSDRRLKRMRKSTGLHELFHVLAGA